VLGLSENVCCIVSCGITKITSFIKKSNMLLDTRRKASPMDKQDTPDNPQSTYRYLHFTPEELSHLPPAQLLQACLESRSLLQIVMGILLSPDANPTERIVACDLIYTQAMRMAKEPSSHHSEDVIAEVKSVSDRLGLRPSAVRAAYEALAERGAVRIDERILPKQRHQLSLPLDQGSSADAHRK
jgi:hypothetical protein